MSEFDSEPVRGLPENLPAGERILWQGAPEWRGTAIRVFHLRLIAIYCIGFFAWRVSAGMADGKSLLETLVQSWWLTPFLIGGIGIPAALAYVFARTTVYTITNERIVMRVGVALPVSFNLPLRKIGSAGLKVYRNGEGDIPLSLLGSDRIAYAHLWPHARPWRLSHPEPMLRCVANAEQVAGVLASALADATGQQMTASASAAQEQQATQTRPLVHATA